jgi:hypothetical protein
MQKLFCGYDMMLVFVKVQFVLPCRWMSQMGIAPRTYQYQSN